MLSSFARVRASTPTQQATSKSDTRLVKAETRSIVYVDIKLPGLRDILRAVLKDIKWVSLADDKPSVSSSQTNGITCSEGALV